jgi:uncharacterized protein YukE
MNDVQVNIESVRDMARSIDKAAETMTEVSMAILKIADIIDDGGLVNRQGQNWSDALRSNVTRSLSRAQDILEELARDVNDAADTFERGDMEARGRFTG